MTAEEWERRFWAMKATLQAEADALQQARERIALLERLIQQAADAARHPERIR